MPCRRATAGPWRCAMSAGCRYPELAEALGRPVNTVKSDVHRGIAMLREALAAEIEVRS